MVLHIFGTLASWAWGHHNLVESKRQAGSLVSREGILSTCFPRASLCQRILARWPVDVFFGDACVHMMTILSVVVVVAPQCGLGGWAGGWVVVVLMTLLFSKRSGDSVRP